MPDLDIAKVNSIIQEVAAIEIMPRFRKLAAGDVMMKGKDDPVTVADHETELHLTRRLTDYLPGSVVVGEEGVARDKALLGLLTGDSPVWVIDPIDGTRNFVAGKPEFAVMVALVRDGQAVASWILDPNTGDMIMAEQGAGVWLCGKKVELATDDPTVPIVCLVGARVKKLIADPALIPQGIGALEIEIGSCAGFDYPRLFAGETIYANDPTTRAAYLIYRHTNPWDHVPGLFLHREGGGFSANWQGEPYEMANRMGGLIVAPDKERWTQMHKAFQPLMTSITKNAVWDV